MGIYAEILTNLEAENPLVPTSLLCQPIQGDYPALPEKAVMVPLAVAALPDPAASPQCPHPTSPLLLHL